MTYEDRIFKAKDNCKTFLENNQRQLEEQRLAETESYDRQVDENFEAVISVIEKGSKEGKTLFKIDWFDQKDFQPKQNVWHETEEVCELNKDGVAYGVFLKLQELKRTGLRARPIMRLENDYNYGGLVTDYWLEVTI